MFDRRIEVFHRLCEFRSVNRGFYRSFESSIGESGVLVGKQELRVEIASFCGGFDRLIAGSIVLLEKVLVVGV